MADKAQRDVIAVVNDIAVRRDTYMGIGGNNFVSYGECNLYPQSAYLSAKNSQTVKGCLKNFTRFTFGKGLERFGELVINGEGDTLNDYLKGVIKDFALYQGFSSHLNVDANAKVTDITNYDFKVNRLSPCLDEILIRDWVGGSGLVEEVEVRRFSREGLNECALILSDEEMAGECNGLVQYYTSDFDIYPLCRFDEVQPSADFQHEVQVYNFASAKNSFNCSGALSLASKAEELAKVKEDIKSMKGSENAGSILVTVAPRNADGNFQDAAKFTPFALPNVDKMFVNQNRQAKEAILEAFSCPEILLGTSSAGMFNQESFNDAFDFYNAISLEYRHEVERAVNAVWKHTIWYDGTPLKIVPLEMKKNNETQKEADVN